MACELPGAWFLDPADPLSIQAHDPSEPGEPWEVATFVSNIGYSNGDPGSLSREYAAYAVAARNASTAAGLTRAALEAGAVGKVIDALHGGKGTERGAMAANLEWAAGKLDPQSWLAANEQAIIVDILRKYAATILAALALLDTPTEGK